MLETLIAGVIGVMVLIVLSIVTICLESVDGIQSDIERLYPETESSA